MIKTYGKCAPSAEKNYKQWKSCLSDNELQTVATLYNEQHPNNLIPQSVFQDTNVLRKELDKRFKKQCGKNNDACWLEQDIVKGQDIYHELNKNFRPKMKESWEKNPRQWLDTYDILNVMKQYEQTCPTFNFLGVFPADVMSKDVCWANNMCNFDLKELLEKGKKEVGAVFNLDNHNQPGSHWVAVYGNFDTSSKKLGVYYYDSFGYPPPSKIKQFTLMLRNQAKAVFDAVVMKRFMGRFNVIQHQFKNSECGMYSMIFIILCLQHTKADFYKIRNSITPKSDDIVNQLRQHLFR